MCWPLLCLCRALFQTYRASIASRPSINLATPLPVVPIIGYRKKEAKLSDQKRLFAFVFSIMGCLHIYAQKWHLRSSLWRKLRIWFLIFIVEGNKNTLFLIKKTKILQQILKNHLNVQHLLISIDKPQTQCSARAAIPLNMSSPFRFFYISTANSTFSPCLKSWHLGRFILGTRGVVSLVFFSFWCQAFSLLLFPPPLST